MAREEAMTVAAVRPEELARGYVEAMGRGAFAEVEPMLAEGLEFRISDKRVDRATYMAILRRLGTIWRGNEIRRVFADGTEACVVYDFLPDVPVGPVRCVEWLRFDDDGRISEIDFIFEREHWGPVEAEMKRRLDALAT